MMENNFTFSFDLTFTGTVRASSKWRMQEIMATCLKESMKSFEACLPGRLERVGLSGRTDLIRGENKVCDPILPKWPPIMDVMP